MGLPPTLTNRGVLPTTTDPAIATAATLPSSETSTVLSSDFETFLKMLTAQAQYQDPLEPIDSSEYASQLAQFSMVEQQVLANDRLAELTAQMTISNMTQMASLIGMDARTTEAVYFDGGALTVDPDPATGADKTVLVVSNKGGFVVQRTEIPVSDEVIQWDGREKTALALLKGSTALNWKALQGGMLFRPYPHLHSPGSQKPVRQTASHPWFFWEALKSLQ